MMILNFAMICYSDCQICLGKSNYICPPPSLWLILAIICYSECRIWLGKSNYICPTPSLWLIHAIISCSECYMRYRKNYTYTLTPPLRSSWHIYALISDQTSEFGIELTTHASTTIIVAHLCNNFLVSCY